MSRLTTIARILLGLGFTVFGLNFFFHFLPDPAPGSVPPGAGQFIGALMASGYVLLIVKTVEVVAGLLLLANRFVPLALTLLAPLLVNIIAFHAVLAPAGLPVPLLLLALELFLAWSYRAAFAPMLRSRVVPAASAATPRASQAVTA